jgi:hypothetical protein
MWVLQLQLQMDEPSLQERHSSPVPVTERTWDKERGSKAEDAQWGLSSHTGPEVVWWRRWS